MTVTTTDWSTSSSVSTMATVPVMQQRLSSSSFEGQQFIASAIVPEIGSYQTLKPWKRSDILWFVSIVQTVKTKNQSSPNGSSRVLIFLLFNSAEHFLFAVVIMSVLLFAFNPEIKFRCVAVGCQIKFNFPWMSLHFLKWQVRGASVIRGYCLHTRRTRQLVRRLCLRISWVIFPGVE